MIERHSARAAERAADELIELPPRRGDSMMVCLRVSGIAFWMETNQWDDFRNYEQELGRALEGRRLIALCTYPLSATHGVDVLDVAHIHHFSIARRKGRSDFLVAPELAAKRRKASLPAGGQIADDWPLTPRERVVLGQIVNGASTKESALALGISPRTVEFHRANIMRKLGARNLADLMNKVFST
jgi:DNA-binding CsgD family transcriptional regulator